MKNFPRNYQILGEYLHNFGISKPLKMNSKYEEKSKMSISEKLHNPSYEI